MTAAETDDFVTRNNVGASRYEVLAAERPIGFADYYLVAGVVAGSKIVVIPHTEIDPAFGGQGVGSRLIEFALADISAAGHRVRPDCSFVAAYLQRHPEYAGLLA